LGNYANAREPGTLAFLGLGAAALVAGGRRKRKLADDYNLAREETDRQAGIRGR